MTKKKKQKSNLWTIEKFANRIKRQLSSNTFFMVVLMLFTAQAAWLAASAAYPMVFDEYYHPTLIALFAEQYSPFVNSQTTDTIAAFGDLTRATSTLFHYLLSFPYRIITTFTDSLYIAVVSMRLINVTFVVLGIVAFRKLFDVVGLSRVVSHSALFLMTLLPLFIYVSATVNYDNLLFLLTPIFLLYGLKVINKQPNFLLNLLIFLTLGLFASLVKFAFLPIFAAAVILVLVHIIYRYRTTLGSEFRRSFKSNNKMPLLIMSALFVVLSCYAFDRYGINYLRYGSITVDCDVLHAEKDCEQNPVFNRGLTARRNREANPPPTLDLPVYTFSIWVPRMVAGSVGVVANTGAAEKLGFDSNTSTIIRKGTSYMYFMVWAALLSGLLIVAYSFRELRKLNGFWYLGGVFAFYLYSVLVYSNFTSYSNSGRAVAIQPRYFLLLLPIPLVFAVQATNLAIKSTVIKLTLFTFTLLLFTQGGGISTYILRSDETWYWRRETILDINMQLKNILKPVIDED